MAKLQTPNTAGFNANNGYTVKFIKIDDIVIDPEIAGLFTVSEKNKNEIVESIKLSGFYKEEPVTLWGKILVDGRTRYTAAKEAGLKEIPAVERDFATRDDAILYTYDRQVLRRNLTPGEMLQAAKTLLNKGKAANGEGRLAEPIAKRLGVHVTTLYKAEAVVREGSEEIIESVKNGKMSLKTAYHKVKQHEKPDVKFNINDSQSLPANVKFLHSAVILLVEKAHREAMTASELAILLINHFLRKNERHGFYDLLPEEVRAQLPDLPVSCQATN